MKITIEELRELVRETIFQEKSNVKKEARNTLALRFTTSTCSMVILSVVREIVTKKVAGLRVSERKEKASVTTPKASL